MKKEYQAYIAGRWRDASSGNRFDSMNPFSGDAWASMPRCNATDVAEAVAAAHEAYRDRRGAWRQLTPSDRGRLLYRLGTLIARDADRLAEVRCSATAS